MRRFILRLSLSLGLLGFCLTNPIAADTTTYDLFGTMLAFQTSQGFGGQRELEDLLRESWVALRTDDGFDAFMTQLNSTYDDNESYVTTSQFGSNRDVVGSFVWNVIVPTPGEYDWAVPDAMMTAAGEAGITISGVIQPYSSWGSSEDLDQANCSSDIDFAYFDYKAGSPQRWNAYKKFLLRTVERYDGDGVDDMPGLTTRVEGWEVANEVEGGCSGNLQKPRRYVKLLRTSYRVIKRADPEAIVLNGGALELVRGDGTDRTSITDFWNEFFDLGGQRYLDAFNMHYNFERSGAQDNMALWKRHLKYFTRLLNSDEIPLWITEFGTMSGTNEISGATQSETFQASWYLRYVTMGMSYGVERYFIDLFGSDGNPTTGAALYNDARKPREFFTTLQTLASLTDGYSAVEQLRSGQYVFTVDAHQVYVLWTGAVPAEIAAEGAVTVYALDGSETTLAGSAVSYSTVAPVMVVVE